MKKILVITDNDKLYSKFKCIALSIENASFDYKCSWFDKPGFVKAIADIDAINLKKTPLDIAAEYEVIISLHCKQLFPKTILDRVRCINIHPGYNPYNRGWYPQVFSIINGLPFGVTIHEIDAELDHGKIIAQEKVKLYPWDTSLTAYDRVLSKEISLTKKYLQKIVDGTYTCKAMEKEGNLNYKRDFNKLCRIHLDEVVTWRDAINRLRALTHGNFSNAHFFDENGNKIVLSLNIRKY